MSFGDSVQSIHSLIGDSFSTSDDDEALASRCERAAGSGSADARFSSFFGIFLVTVCDQGETTLSLLTPLPRPQIAVSWFKGKVWVSRRLTVESASVG